MYNVAACGSPARAQQRANFAHPLLLPCLQVVVSEGQARRIVPSLAGAAQ